MEKIRTLKESDLMERSKTKFPKRLTKAIGLFPVLACTFIPERLIYSIRWIITGKEFPDKTIIYRFIFDW